MKRILIAAAATVAFAGIAAAQEAPVYTGNYGAAVTQSLRSHSEVQSTAPRAQVGVDYATTSSVNANNGGSDYQSNPNQSTVPTFAHQ